MSFCSLATLILDETLTSPWPKLQEVNLQSNPWRCNCELLKILDVFNQNGTNSVKTFEDHNNKLFARCDTPHIVAGIRLTNLSRSYICEDLPKLKNIIVVEEIERESEPPRFLRPRNIALTIIVIAIVIALGVIVGFVIVIIKRKLKREDFGVSPIRYSTVRNSTLPT